MKRYPNTCSSPCLQMERRGLAWVMGAFAICPCHLPLTLALMGTVLSETAVGAMLNRHVSIAGALIAVVWAAGTWRGLCYLRSARRIRRAKP